MLSKSKVFIKKKTLTDFERNALTIGMILVCCIFILIKSIFIPFRVYDNLVYLEVVANDGATYGIYDCRIEEYLSGKIIIYHDSGMLEIADIDNIKFYIKGE
jgi:hypothetical protein